MKASIAIRSRSSGRPGVGWLLAAAAAAAVGSAPLAGCASKGEPFRPAVAPEGAGVIYIFRAPGGGPFAGGRLPVFVDQQAAGEIGGGEYIAWGAGPGEHLIRVEGDSEATALVELRGDQPAFLEIRTEAFGSKPVLERRSQEEGMRLLSETREAPVNPD
jgi:hypothetical protein